MEIIINDKKVELQKVDQAQRFVLQNLLEFYVYDFTEYMDFDVDENGLFKYPLDDYFKLPTHHAYFIKLNGILIGFVLQYSYQNDENQKIQTIGEFFIMKKYRKQGLGEIVAKSILKATPGEWLVYESERNLPAQAFWRKVISECTLNQYQEYYKDEKPHQRFSILV